MGTNAAAVHTCDSCGRNVKHGIMDSSFESRSLDRLWTLRISTCLNAVQINEEWCSECIQIRVLDIDLKRAIRRPFKLTKQRRFRLPPKSRITQLERELDIGNIA